MGIWWWVLVVGIVSGFIILVLFVIAPSLQKSDNAPKCILSSECFDPRPVCRNGVCGPTCETSSHCSDPTPVCKNGVCAAECVTSAECLSTNPVCREGVCGPECVISEDCETTAPVCRSGVCGTECLANSDCNSTSYCDINQSCIACPIVSEQNIKVVRVNDDESTAVRVTATAPLNSDVALEFKNSSGSYTQGITIHGGSVGSTTSTSEFSGSSTGDDEFTLTATLTSAIYDCPISIYETSVLA
jgi:hypothetical protein